MLSQVFRDHMHTLQYSAICTYVFARLSSVPVHCHVLIDRLSVSICVVVCLSSHMLSGKLRIPLRVASFPFLLEESNAL